ncbi:MAG: ester cyclase [Flavobacteriaceae bacterium]|nr:ester cyclase [Flavobacteriaceae bacterium]
MNNLKQTIAKTYFEAFYDGTTSDEAVTKVENLLADDFTDYVPAFGGKPTKAGFKQTVKTITSAFTQQYKVKHLFIDGNIYTAVWEAKIRHTGEFMNIPPTN